MVLFLTRQLSQPPCKCRVTQKLIRNSRHCITKAKLFRSKNCVNIDFYYVFHALSCSGYPVLFISGRRQTCLSYEKKFFSVFFPNDSVNSKRAHPPWAFVGCCQVSAVGNCQKTSARGWGICQFF